MKDPRALKATQALMTSADETEASFYDAMRHGDVDKVITELETTPVATAEEAAKFEADRIAARGQSVTTKDGEVADGGGGNRRKPKKAQDSAEAETATQATGDALLA